MTYNVVYENTSKHGGYAGLRFMVFYDDSDQFHKMNNDPEGRVSVIAENITRKEAKKLVSLTPEISNLTWAAEESCVNGKIDEDLVSIAISNAVLTLFHDRMIRHENKISVKPGFPIFEVGPENTELNQLLRIIKEKYTDPNGNINGFGEAFDFLEDAIAKIVANRKQTVE